METDKIPQETPTVQAPLENEPIHKSFLNQKGSFLLILGAVVIIFVVLGAGGYFLMQKQNPGIPSPQIPTQQTTSKFQGTVAFIRENNLWVSINGTEKQLTTDAIPAEIPFETGLPKIYYGYPKLSPDGTKVAFLKFSGDNTNSETLYVVNIDGSSMKKLADDVAWGYWIIQWSNQNDKIFYSTYTPQTGTFTGTYGTIHINQVAISTGSQNKLVDYDMTSGGCGGGSSDPADHLAQAENVPGLGYSYGISVFQLSPANDYLIHTINCFGQGIAVLNLKSNQDKIINTDMTNAVISPTGSMIAAISDKILIFDAKAGKAIKSLATSEKPSNLLWSSDEKAIYYISLSTGNELKVPDEIAMQMETSYPLSYQENNAVIRKIEIDSQKDTKIAQFNAHTLRLININKDRTKIIASLVENSTNLWDYVISKKTKQNLVKYYPRINIMEIDSISGLSKTIINNAKESSYLSD